MLEHGKRYNKAAELVEPNKRYGLTDAVGVLKSFPPVKFDQTIELAFKLGVDPRQSDQMVRGTVALPHGSGKDVKVAVFAKGAAADAAKEAGANFVGYEDLVKRCQGGWCEFDVAIATPEAMQEVRKLGKVLGPRGLMPNPKTGTVTDDTAKAVNEVKAGRVEFKMDKTGNLHVLCGRLSFDAKKVEENVRAVVNAIAQSKPPASKGQFIQSCTISSTMSPGIKVDLQGVVVG